MEIDEIRRLIQPEMQTVNERIHQRLHSGVDLINQMGDHIVSSGGKRLRPILVLIVARAWGYTGDRHIDLATVIEFIHTATLLHDDVVDASKLRRGQETANSIWGDQASVLVGDFLYSRALQILAELDNVRYIEIIAHAVNTISEGEVKQLLNQHNPDVTEEHYRDVIYRKTAMLFGSAAQAGSVVNSCKQSQELAMRQFGIHLGTAFQLVYSGSPENIGKNLGDDLAEGKPTLPLIYAMRCGSKSQAAQIQDAIRQGGRDNIAQVTEIIESTGAIDYTAQAAETEAQLAIQALDCLPESPYKQALQGLATFSAQRDH